jgi:hypothetical protein
MATTETQTARRRARSLFARSRKVPASRQTTLLRNGFSKDLRLSGGTVREFIDDVAPRLARLAYRPKVGFFVSMADKFRAAAHQGRVLEYDVKTDRWKDYNDPDGETEMVVLKDQGLIHEIITSVSWIKKDKILWVATYFGASRYDGRYWKNLLDKDSGLPSNFMNQVKVVDGSHAWFATDKGLTYYDGMN